MPVRVSLDAKLYYGPAGTTASTLLNTVGDVTLSLKKSETKISSRASRWALFKGALKEAEISFEVVDDSSDGALRRHSGRLHERHADGLLGQGRGRRQRSRRRLRGLGGRPGREARRRHQVQVHDQADLRQPLSVLVGRRRCPRLTHLKEHNL